MAKIIDLSKPIKEYEGDLPFMKVEIEHKSHHDSQEVMKTMLGASDDFFSEDFIGWADDTIHKMGVHSTTHIDAPWHYNPTVDGKPARTIDQMPLEWGYGDGIVIDMSHKEDLEIITKEEIIDALEKMDLEIEEGNIVLIKTGRDKYIGTNEYPMVGTGMGREATEWLIDQGVRVMGIDQWGWDLPLYYQVQVAKERNDPEFFWQGHKVGAEKEYYHMEQLVNLDALPSHGFKVAVFPLKIVGASAAPARVVAIME